MLLHPTHQFIAFPGYVKSLTDGDDHYIGFSRLCMLYRVDPSKVALGSETTPLEIDHPAQSLIPLVPLSGGNYPDYSNPEVVAFERYRIDKELGKDVHPASIAD